MSNLLLIDDTLKITLRKLEEFLGIEFDANVVSAIFEDEELGSIAAKIYPLFRRPNTFWFAWIIEGVVDEHEPETIWIQSRNGFSNQKKIDTFFERLSS